MCCICNMAGEGKKISFGFSKSIKKPVLQNAAAQEKAKVDYIECVDDKSIKIIGGEEKKDEPLVIPLLGTKTWHDRIINKVDADIFETKATEHKVKDEPMQGIEIKQEKVEDVSNGDATNENTQPMEAIEIKKEPVDNNSLTLEEQAAREIIADLKSDGNKDKQEKVFALPITNDDDLQGKEESTLEDYEQIPIDAFGMAMLRGMGWEPGKGIGKNEKVVPPAIPELRPKGMGLGADKLAIKNAKAKSKEEEQLRLVKGCYVKIIAGKHSNSYGQVEGFDEDAARIILKLALKGEVISMNELCVQPVTSSEYSQNAKVLNVKRYEEYIKNEIITNDKPKYKSSKNIGNSEDESHQSRKDEKSKKDLKKRRQKSSDDESADRNSRKRKESSKSSDEEQTEKKKSRKRKSSGDDSSIDRKSRRKETSNSSDEEQKQKKKPKKKRQQSPEDSSDDEKSKKKSKKKKHTSDEDSSNDRKSRKKRDSSSSSVEESRKSKKSKKHKNRDSSSERSSRKNRKKDKEREKSRYKKSDYDNSSDRARQRSHRRSRSRSHTSKNHRRDRS